MGGGASTCIGQGDTAQSEGVLGPAQGSRERLVIRPDGTLFRQRASRNNVTIAGMDHKFTQRWSFSGEERFSIASLELLSTLLKKETASEVDNLDVFDRWINDKSIECKVRIQKQHVNAVSTSIKQQRA